MSKVVVRAASSVGIELSLLKAKIITVTLVSCGVVAILSQFITVTVVENSAF